MKNSQGLYRKKVNCYNAPECGETITVQVASKSDNPRKLCEYCIASGHPSERKTSGDFSAMPTTGQGSPWNDGPFFYSAGDLEVGYSVWVD